MRNELIKHILDTLADQTAGGHWIDASQLAIAANVSVVSVRNVLREDPTVLMRSERRPTMTRLGKNGTHRVQLYQARPIADPNCPYNRVCSVGEPCSACSDS